MSPVEFRSAERFVSGGCSATFPVKVAAEIEKRSVKSLDLTHEGHGPFGDFAAHNAITYPQMNYLIRKRPNLKELIINDFTLTVHDYAPEPEYYNAIHPAVATDEVYVYFELSKSNAKLPWRFKPSKAMIGGNVVPWSKGLISLRDDFTTRLHIAVHAKDYGFYTFSVEGEFLNDFNRISRELMTREPLTFLFLPIKEPRILNGLAVFDGPKDGEEVFVLGPYGSGRETYHMPALPFPSVTRTTGPAAQAPPSLAGSMPLPGAPPSPPAPSGREPTAKKPDKPSG